MMFNGAICLTIILTMVICKVLVGGARVVALVALGCGSVCMIFDGINLDKATQDIKKLKETDNEKTE